MHARFASPLSSLPTALKMAVSPIIEDDKFASFLSAQQVHKLKQQTGLDDDTLALELLPLAAACAVVPLSNFNVGAVGRGETGCWYFGANMEFLNTSLQQSVHAEQSLIMHAWHRGETRLETITVNHSPCGHCRQFMTELNSGTDIRISLPQRPVQTLEHYLCDSFGPGNLGIKERLLCQINHDYKVKDASRPLLDAAVDAACKSYAPYTMSHCGVALMSAKGNIYSGRYAENAAHNPSMPPLQSALILMNMSGEYLNTIVQAVLAESESPLVTQRLATEATLMKLGCNNFEMVFIYK